MRRVMVLAVVSCAVLVLGGWAWSSRVQSGDEPAAAKKAAPAPALPIRQVVLFNSGVGYVQREGDVVGDAKVDLAFQTSDVNDLLKSLVLQDLGGGRISSVSYDSLDPLEKILRSFAIDLNNNPTFGQILNQARGEKIEVQLMGKEKAIPAKVVGQIVGMEAKTSGASATAADFLNLSGEGGLQSIPLEQVLGVRFLNPTLEAEFQRALRVLAGSHDAEKKVVSLGFNGAGKRAVRVGYVVERPIWKTTYRLRLEPNGKVFLQGWALVENTSDDDWNDVRMALVSGKPISFKMNLYEPLYIPRPTVEPEQFASLRPPVYSGALNAVALGGGGATAGPAPTPPSEGGPANLGAGIGGALGGIGGGFGGGGALGGAPPGNVYGGTAGSFNGGSYLGNIGAIRGGQLGQIGQIGQIGGVNLGNLGGMNGNPYQNLNPRSVTIDNRLTYDELRQRRAALAEIRSEAKENGAAVALNFKEGIQTVASAEEVGDYFQYLVDQRITLSRQKSAMLPIIDRTIEGAKISVFNEGVHSKFPLLGLRLKNTSGQPLTQGPITVYDNATYAGDTRILDLQPGEERLLSYALDQGTEVKVDVKSSPSPEMTFKIGQGSMSAVYKQREAKTYTIKNRSTHDRVVIVEHAIREGWKLVQPGKPAEQTRDVYRFEVKAPPGAVATLTVEEDQPRVDEVALAGGEPQYVAGSGITVKEIVTTTFPKLESLRVLKGMLTEKMKVSETRTRYIQNLSEVDRTFTIDHIVRKDWTLLPAKGEAIVGPAVHRTVIGVEKRKAGFQETREERIDRLDGRLAGDLNEFTIREYLNSPVVSDAMKAGLTKQLALRKKLADEKHAVAALEAHLTALNVDQTRLRENLKIIPQTAEPYKTFLEKFVTQEAEVERLQRQIRTGHAAVAAALREYDAFLNAWTAD